MKKNFFLSIVCVLFIFSASSAQSAKQLQVEQRVEQLRKAMVDGDSAMLDDLAATALTYGHSGGNVDTKAEFISKIISGKSDFVTIELSNQTIVVSGKTAVVRHSLNAVTNDNGKAGEVHLNVLLIWQKLKGNWRLLARQAVKQPK